MANRRTVTRLLKRISRGTGGPFGCGKLDGLGTGVTVPWVDASRFSDGDDCLVDAARRRHAPLKVDLRSTVDAAIPVEDRIGQLEEEIENVHAEERIDEIERRVAPAIERLKALMRKLEAKSI